MDWSGPGVGAKVSAFRRDVIDLDIVTREVRERSMFGFVCLLHKYTFTEVRDDSFNICDSSSSNSFSFTTVGDYSYNFCDPFFFLPLYSGGEVWEGIWNQTLFSGIEFLYREIARCYPISR